MDWRRVRANYLQEDINGYSYRNMLNNRFPNWNRLKGPPGDHTSQTPDGMILFKHWYNLTIQEYDHDADG